MNLRTLPKIELHLHLDCCLSYDVVRRRDPDLIGVCRGMPDAGSIETEVIVRRGEESKPLCTSSTSV
jgi:hypothetical protein